MKTQIALVTEKIFGIDMVTAFTNYSEIPLPEYIQRYLSCKGLSAELARMEDKEQIVYTERDVLIMLQTLYQINKMEYEK